ncbi:hypothetical protein F1712_11755, partial [Streptococcus pneumoniae]
MHHLRHNPANPKWPDRDRFVLSNGHGSMLLYAGMPMGMAEIAEVLWIHHLRHNPANPKWPDRDRFVLSNGHGSMLLYA